MAFAAMGAGQPVGFSIGLTVGGVLVDSPATWRAGFYVAAGINTVALFLSIGGLPRVRREEPMSWARLRKEIDWTGAILLSTSLGMLSYVFAALTGAVSNITRPASITLLVAAIVLMAAFVFWVGRQERLGRPAIIPNSLWRNKVFTSICLDVFLLWGAFNATETLLTFFFQEVQMLSATNTSIRFLPAPIVGTVVNLLMGAMIHRVRANWAIILATLISCVSPILTAVMGPSDSYWEFVFPSIALNALGPDVLFTASNLIITDAFPDRTQALAGGVFNTVAQIGKSVGLALSAVIAASVSAKADHHQPEQLVLLEGYQAAWWFILGITALTIVISAIGLRGIGRIGLKRE
jgi:Na+/melibiose symporter-like transporter